MGRRAFTTAVVVAALAALSACSTSSAEKTEGRSESQVRAALRACDKLPMEQREGCRVGALAEEQRTIERGG